jgi:hypothetical protein
MEEDVARKNVKAENLTTKSYLLALLLLRKINYMSPKSQTTILP